MADPLAGLAGLVAVDENGRVAGDAACPPRGCAGLNVVAAELGELPALVGRLAGRDMLIALERPPPESGDLLSVGIAGEGFDGTADVRQHPVAGAGADDRPRARRSSSGSESRSPPR